MDVVRHDLRGPTGSPSPFRVELRVARFVVDATGPGGLLPRALELPDATHCLRTRSRTLYTHLEGVRPFEELLVAAGADVSEHPFSCDRSAQHHLLDGAPVGHVGHERARSAARGLDGRPRPVERLGRAAHHGDGAARVRQLRMPDASTVR